MALVKVHAQLTIKLQPWPCRAHTLSHLPLCSMQPAWQACFSECTRRCAGGLSVTPEQYSSCTSRTGSMSLAGLTGSFQLATSAPLRQEQHSQHTLPSARPALQDPAPGVTLGAVFCAGQAADLCPTPYTRPA